MMLVAICLVISQRMRQSGTVTEIRCLKDNGVTSLNFWGHVTSSVTWPFDSRGWTSYGWSIVTMHVSGTQEQKSVVGWSILNITLISYTPLRYVRKVLHKE